MKSPIAAVLLLLFISFTPAIFGQDLNKPSCVKTSYQPQIDSMKSLLGSQGFYLLREASMTMESAYAMPVVMSLAEGSNYYVVFIGDPGSAVYEISMTDQEERQVFYKKQEAGNVIHYNYQPRQSENHMLKPLQVNKYKLNGLCGFVMLFKKVS
jgi:hypothetical protein